MEHRRWMGVVLAMSLGFLALGCEGDTIIQEAGDTFSEYTYQGNFGEPCLHCHSTAVEDVLDTNHSFAFEDLGESQENLYCLQCHTTGFDSEVSFGDTEIADENRGPDEHGYDDYIGIDTEEAAARRLALEAVQCENCHGPMGPNFNAHKPDISFSTHYVGTESTSLCEKCHHTQVEEWVESGHANAAGGNIDDFNDEHYATSSSCGPCHTSEGFIAANDVAYADYEFGDERSFIGCPTCHDPHKGEAGGGNYAQLRNVTAEEVQYTFPLDPGEEGVPTMEGYGPAQTCVQCHHARRDNDDIDEQITLGDSHFGPHHSNQMDMYIGAGSYEIPGYTYDGVHQHQGITLACVECHMVRETELHGELVDHPFHTWEPTVENCLPCHAGIPDFDVNGMQTQIQGKLDQLAVLHGYIDFADLEANWDSEAPGVLVWEREALYAAFFIYDDGSTGLHNPTYANSLLDNAIAYTILMQGP